MSLQRHFEWGSMGDDLVAVHEAGHAVVSIIGGLQIAENPETFVSIDIGSEQPVTNCISFYEPTYVALYKLSSEHMLLRAKWQIVRAVAGPIAEFSYNKPKPSNLYDFAKKARRLHSGRDDYESVSKVLEQEASLDSMQSVRRLEKVCIDIVFANRHAIEILAKELERQRKMEFEAAYELVRGQIVAFDIDGVPYPFFPAT